MGSQGENIDWAAEGCNLCSRCKELRLTPDSFRVTQREHNWSDMKSDASSCCLASGTEPLRYILSENADTSGDCKLCSLIRDTIASSRKTGEVTEYFVAWDLDGPHVEDGSKFVNTSRRLKVSWTRKVGLKGEEGAKTDSGKVGHCKNSEVKEELFLLPATDLLPELTKPDCNQRLILKWLHMCETKHDNPHPLTQGEWKRRFRDLVVSGYFGVIDVVDKQLCALPMADDGEPAPYVALSYVWGNDASHEALRTTGENVLSRASLDTPGGLGQNWESFPATIRDALRLVEDFSKRRSEQDGNKVPQLRYLWIDLLCIVQDRPKSWEHNARRMDLIYGNAYFTICAADESNPATLGSAIAPTATGLVALNPGAPEPVVAQLTPDVRVRVLMSPDHVIDASEWNRRGWTFQERILSRRCVIFTEGRIFFQCRQTSWSQEDDPDEAGNGMESAWRDLLHRRYKELESKPIKFFMKAVEKYTGRNMTYATDILDAFSGVSQLMKWYLCSHLHFGLPASHFDLALLWKPLAGKSRRTWANLTEKQKRHGRADVEFPSWSWCGWMDSEDQGKGARVIYDSEFLGGFIDDDDIGTRDWLLHHTWIIWFVRDREGKLHPLWEGPTVPPSTRCKATPQWLGYKSRPRGRSSCWVKHLDIPENMATGEGVDDYGRPLKDSWWRRLAKEKQPHRFKERLPDNPFAVRGPCLGNTRSYMFFDGGHDSHSDSPSNINSNYMSFSEVGLDHQPYQPILQFWTLKCEFGMVPDHSSLAGDHLQRYHVFDLAGDKCGTVVVDESWKDKKQHYCTFIALSEAKAFTEKEWSSVSRTNYSRSAREDGAWPLFYVMAITKDTKRGVWERLGLGKVFQLAFENGGCKWDEIVLG